MNNTLTWLNSNFGLTAMEHKPLLLINYYSHPGSWLIEINLGRMLAPVKISVWGEYVKFYTDQLVRTAVRKSNAYDVRPLIKLRKEYYWMELKYTHYTEYTFPGILTQMRGHNMVSTILIKDQINDFISSCRTYRPPTVREADREQCDLLLNMYKLAYTDLLEMSAWDLPKPN